MNDIFSLLPPFTLSPPQDPLLISTLVEGKLVCLSLIFPNHSAVISPWLDHPSSAISLHQCVCLCVCWTLSSLAALHFPAWNRPRFPSNGPRKRLRSPSAATEIPRSRERLLGLARRRNGASERAARGLPRAQLRVYCGWCIWRQPLTALQPFEPHIKGWQNGGHCAAVWSVEMSRRHQTWTIVDLNFKKVCGKPVYPLLLNTELFQINHSMTQHSEHSHPMAGDLSWFKVEVFSTGTNSTPHLHDAKLSHLSAAAQTAGS